MASYSDDFNRANGPLGANWTVDVGTLTISSNRVLSGSGGGNAARYTGGALASANHFSQCTCAVDRAVNDYGGPIARQASSTLTFYMGYYADESLSTGYRLIRVVSGVDTLLDSDPSGTGLITMKLEVDGSTQELYVGGVLEASASDTQITSGLYAGIIGYNSESALDDWQSADLAIASVKEVDGLAIASVKEVDGLAIASVKSIMGLE